MKPDRPIPCILCFPWSLNQTASALALRFDYRFEIGPHGDEIGENAIGFDGGEFGGVVGAGRHTPAGEPGVVRGFNIPGRITDEQRGGGITVDLLEHVVGEFGLGFDPGGIAGAEDSCHVGRDAEVFATGSRDVATFIRKHREGCAERVGGFDDLESARHQSHVLKHDGLCVGHENFHGGVELMIRKKLSERAIATAADDATDLLHRGGWRTE